VDDKLLSEPLRQPLADEARVNVVLPAGGEADNNAHRPRRIGLRPCEARDGRQRGSDGGKMQKLSAGKFNFKSSRCALFIRSLRRCGAPAIRRTVVLKWSRLVIRAGCPPHG